VLPLVNKALTIYQWRQDVVQAEELLRKALEYDAECDSAIATLAQLTLQQGKLGEAIELFSKHANIARTVQELELSLTFKYVCGRSMEDNV
jgi:import receptor subunit TOM70